MKKRADDIGKVVGKTSADPIASTMQKIGRSWAVDDDNDEQLELRSMYRDRRNNTHVYTFNKNRSLHLTTVLSNSLDESNCLWCIQTHWHD